MFKEEELFEHSEIRMENNIETNIGNNLQNNNIKNIPKEIQDIIKVDNGGYIQIDPSSPKTDFLGKNDLRRDIMPENILSRFMSPLASEFTYFLSKENNTLDNNEVSSKLNISNSSTIITSIINPYIYDDNLLLLGTNDGQIQYFEVSSKKVIKMLNVHESPITCMIHLNNLNHSTDCIASCSIDKTIKLIKLSTGKILVSLADHSEAINCLIPTIDKFNNFCIASAGKDKSIKVWNLQKTNPSCFRTLIGHKDEITCMAPLNGNMFASCSEDKSIRIWNSYPGECLKILEGHKSGVTSLISYSKKCKDKNSGWINMIASGDKEGKINLWNVDEYSKICTLNDCKKEVLNLYKLEKKDGSSSEDSNLLSVCSDKIFIHNLRTNKCSTTIEDKDIKFGLGLNYNRIKKDLKEIVYVSNDEVKFNYCH